MRKTSRKTTYSTVGDSFHLVKDTTLSSFVSSSRSLDRTCRPGIVNGNGVSQSRGKKGDLTFRVYFTFSFQSHWVYVDLLGQTVRGEFSICEEDGSQDTNVTVFLLLESKNGEQMYQKFLKQIV